MRILFLHGWQSVPGGVKPTYLKDHGHEVINPKLPDEDFAEAVKIAQAEFDEHQPQVIVGSSRGGAVAMNIRSGEARVVLLCPAWKKWGAARIAKPGTVILHSRADDVVPFADSEELAKHRGTTLIEVGSDHRLADSEPLVAMLSACESCSLDAVEVTVYYLEMLVPSHRVVPPPRHDLTVVHVKAPSVAYYRSLYDAVGKEFHWLSRRKMSDEALAALLRDPQIEMHVLHVDGTPAGFAELDRRQPDEIELVQFGLTRVFIGQGLGKWFLQWTIDTVWSYGPKRFWLHTCSLDHPAALPNYTKSGFALTKQELIRREL
jgi:GNAT superfamily N-acetyltransferase